MLINYLSNDSNKGKNYKNMTVGEWLVEWFHNYAFNFTEEKYVKGKFSKNSYASEQYRMKSILNYIDFCSIPLDKVSTGDIYKLWGDLKSTRKLVSDNANKLKLITYKNRKRKNFKITYKNGYTNDTIYNYDSIYKIYENLLSIYPSLIFNKEIFEENINNLNNYNSLDEKKELSYKSKKNTIDLIRMAFRCATKLEIIKNNPFDNYSYEKALEYVYEEKVVLTEKERDIFLKVSEMSKYFVLFLLMAFTGLRKAEALGLKVKDIHLDKNYIEVNQQLIFIKPDNRLNTTILAPCKSMHSKRKVPIGNNELRNELKRLTTNKKENGLLFSYLEKDPVVTYHKAYKEIKCLFNICYLITGNKKYLKCSNHTLRHTFATLYLSKYPECIVQISAILGHSNTAFTAKQYIHLDTAKIDTSKLGERKTYIDNTTIITNDNHITNNKSYFNSYIDELKSLKELLDNDILTKEEFNKMKQNILKL